jgi:hypothetical protein
MTHWRFSISALLFVLGWGCGSRELKVAEAEAFPPTFTNIRRRILEPRCVSCHSILVAHEQLINGLVVPGKPSRSELYTVIESGEMPSYGKKLEEPELNSIKTWIEKGAPND